MHAYPYVYIDMHIGICIGKFLDMIADLCMQTCVCAFKPIFFAVWPRRVYRIYAFSFRGPWPPTRSCKAM